MKKELIKIANSNPDLSENVSSILDAIEEKSTKVEDSATYIATAIDFFDYLLAFRVHVATEIAEKLGVTAVVTHQRNITTLHLDPYKVFIFVEGIAKSIAISIRSPSDEVGGQVFDLYDNIDDIATTISDIIRG